MKANSLRRETVDIRSGSTGCQLCSTRVSAVDSREVWEWRQVCDSLTGMENSDLISQRAMLVQANEQSQLQPPGRNARQRPQRSDGATGAEAAGVTE